jgi:cytochrome c553
MSAVMRVPTDMHAEAKRIAALRGQQPKEILGQAWQEYLDRHREEFAADLEEAARLLRTGTVADVADFASRNVSARAEAAAERARGKEAG